ncbi:MULTISPECIES: methyltransferase family protein [unclassified Saccharicrinis]|uniref:methyltransferase family protein n=1 Tax=unclassified Saccharicrinis TaxID=2646859 RepID=UPI003D3527A7
MELFFRIFLPSYIIVYILVLYIENISSFKKKYGIDPEVVTPKDKLMYIFQVYRQIIFVFILMAILMYSAFPNSYHILVPIPYLEIGIVRISGATIMVGSLVLVRVSQLQLKSSWRIGIDRSGKRTDLITTGIYRRSRNPIALGMVLNALGLFMTLPNVITFCILNLVFMIFTVRIRIEEEHLAWMHGDEYEDYKNKTRRWL